MLYLVARTLAQGWRAGLASVAGVALGNLGNALGASIGLAALFALSSLAFTVVKFAGAAHLVWLGIQVLVSRRAAATNLSHEGPVMRRIFRDGALVAFLNPKTALFFAALLPQFMVPGASPLAQSIGYGAGFVLIAACTNLAYVLAAGAAALRMARFGRSAARPLGRSAARPSATPWAAGRRRQCSSGWVSSPPCRDLAVRSRSRDSGHVMLVT